MGGFAWGLAGEGPVGRMQVRQDQEGHTQPREKLVQRNGMKEIISGSHEVGEWKAINLKG